MNIAKAKNGLGGGIAARFSLIWVFCLAICMAVLPGTSANAGDVLLDRLARKADVIVEGIVMDKQEATDQIVQTHIGQSETPVVLDFGQSHKTLFKVSKVYKGTVREHQSVLIYTYPDIDHDISELSLNKRYVLFLKTRRPQDGYIIMEHGRGSWRIFDYNNANKVKAWYQYTSVRAGDAYQDYDDFVSQLETNLAYLK